MTDPLEGLRKVLALEGSKKYSNTAVVGGLDAFFQGLVARGDLSPSHPVARILESLPPGGYRDLHVITRRRVVDELLRAAGQTPVTPPVEPSSRTGLRIVSRSEPPVAPTPTAPKRPARKASAPKPPTPGPRPATVPGTVDARVSDLSGKGVMEGRLAKLDIHTVRDLLFHFPTRYHDYSEVRPIAEMEVGEEQTVIGDIRSVSPATIGRRKATEAVISDSSGMRVICGRDTGWHGSCVRG